MTKNSDSSKRFSRKDAMAQRKKNLIRIFTVKTEMKYEHLIQALCIEMQLLS